MLYIIIAIIVIFLLMGAALYFGWVTNRQLEKALEEERKLSHSLSDQLRKYQALKKIEEDRREEHEKIDSLSGNSLANKLSNGGK